MGSKGGMVKGPSKARSSEQARAAVMARWEKAAKAKLARAFKGGKTKKAKR
jgi:hypothetical protein